jgi:hypothetical protein
MRLACRRAEFQREANETPNVKTRGLNVKGLDVSDTPPMSNRVRSNANLRPFQKGNTASKGKGRPKDLARLGDLFTTELVQRVHVSLAGKVVKKSLGRDFGGPDGEAGHQQGWDRDADRPPIRLHRRRVDFDPPYGQGLRHVAHRRAYDRTKPATRI